MKRPKIEIPLRITLLYLLFGGLWILLSDWVLLLLVAHDAVVTTYQTLKGWLFIVISGSLLYLLLRADLTARKRTQEDLQNSQEQMIGIINSAMDAIITTDAYQHIVVFNPAAEVMFRCKQAEALGQPLEHFIPHRFRSSHQEYMQAFAQTGATNRTMRRLGTLYGLRHDGKEFPIEASISRTRVAGKSLFTVILRDVTERKQAEQQTVQVKRLYATLSQVNQTIVRVKSQQELFESICKVAVEFGEFRLAWIGLFDEETGQVMSVAEHGTGENRLPFRNIRIQEPPFTEGLISLSIQSGIAQFSSDIQADPHMAHWREIAARDGYHSAAAVPICQAGQIIGFLNLYAAEIGFFTVKEEQDLLKEMGLDISFALDVIAKEAERKRAEESLQLANARFQHMIDANIVGIVVGDASGKIILANDYYLKLLGMTRQDFLEGKVDWRKFTPPEWRPVDEKAIQQLHERGICESYEKEYVRADGTRVSVYLTDAMLPGPEEQIIAIILDITERKRAEEEIQSRSRQLTALLEASQSLTESLNLAEVLQKITNQAAGILETERAAIYLTDGEHLYLGASTPPLSPDFPDTLRRTTVADHPHLRQALVSGQPVILPDAAHAELTPAEQIVVNSLGLRTILYVPLAAKKDAEGILVLATLAQPREFSQNEKALVRALSNQAALAIANAKLYEDLARHVKELENHISERKQAQEQLRRHVSYLTGLREVDQAIASSFDVRLSLSIITSRAVPLLNVDAAAILLLDPIMNTLEYIAGHGFYKNILFEGSIRLGESYAGRVVLERQMIHVPDLANELHYQFQSQFLKEEKVVSYYGIPLIVKGKVVGVMEVFHRRIVKRDQEWFDFLDSLAGQAAIAIDNAHLWEQVQRHARDLELRVVERTTALNRTNAELEQANRAKDEFLANMSHELRSPLNTILGLTESLLEQRRDPLTDYQQKSLQIVSSSGQHLLELINDVLDLSKIEAGKFDYYPQTIELDALCRSSLSFVKSLAVRKSITITYDNETSISNMAADPRRLKQILVNLLTNAVKFTAERGKVTLGVRADKAQDLIQFSVIDNGIGIAPQDLKRLFQPFVQVDSKLNRQFEGTGLGLALVQQLTDLHGGSVEVESEVGVGSRFTVNLPWRQEDEASQEITEEADSEESRESDIPTEAPARGLILLADDNAANILTIAEYLETHGYNIVKAHDGLEAVEKAEANNPNIILMDIQMPVVDGMEAIRRLRANSRFATTPIIAITALAMPGDREHCLEAGANEYMSKPVRLKMLLKTIVSLSGQKT